VTSDAVTLHVFCSVKGGVGKSTLAVACAKLLADAGRVPVLIDADLTGTSLADGLRLCAPEVETRKDRSANLAAPTGRLLSHTETVSARRARDRIPWEETPPPPVYLNDLLIHGHAQALVDEELTAECPVKPLLWRHELDDGVGYLPSSPLRTDVSIALSWLYRDERFTWIRRMTWLLDGMRQEKFGLTDVVLDLPPGVFGFSLEVMALMAQLAKDHVALPPGFPSTWGDGGWIGRPYLVTTQDRNDLLVAVDYFVQNRREVPTLKLLVNKRTEGFEAIREAVREHVGPVFNTLDGNALAPIDDLRGTLGALFQADGDLRVTSEVRALRQALRLPNGEVRP